MQIGLARWIDVVIAVILVASALAVRIPIAVERHVLPAGDVFNFQNIVENLLRGTYPQKENRLPGFPFLILLTRPFPVDPVTAAVGISVTVSSLTLACLYGLGRALSIHRIPLVTALALSLFDPLLIVSAVRPLSDATFIFFLCLYLFLVTRQLRSSAPPTWCSLLVIGAASALMMLTRFEGWAITALTLPLLWLKLPWRKVLTAASLPLLAGVLWVPMHIYIHGSLLGGYLKAFSQPSSDFGNLHAVPEKLVTLVRSAGWGNTWTLPEYEIGQEPHSEAMERLFTNGTWWASILAILGIGWLFLTARKAALPLLLAATGYISILVWWFLYSRFVTPLVPIFYISVAVGGSFLIAAARQTVPKIGSWAVVAPSLFLIWILANQALILHKQAVGRAWENNYHGYALFSAIRESARNNNPATIAYWNEGHAFATLYLKHDAFYLSSYPDESPEQLYNLLRQYDVYHLINVGEDPRLPPLHDLLQKNGAIVSTTTYRNTNWSDLSTEVVTVDNLKW